MKNPEPEDIGSRSHREELAWIAVYAKWQAGDPEPMAEWLRKPDTAIVEDARAFLADLLLGKVKRKRGNKRLHKPAEERAIVAQVYAMREALKKGDKYTTPARLAVKKVAKLRKTTHGTIRGIVQRLQEAGITYKFWKKHRPNW